MTEQGGWGKRITLLEGKKVRIQGNGEDSVLSESAASRPDNEEVEGKKLGRYIFPANTLETLRPLLKKPYESNRISRDEGFWSVETDYSLEDAYKTIKKVNETGGGIGFNEIAGALLTQDEDLVAGDGGLNGALIYQLLKDATNSLRNEFSKLQKAK